MKNILFVLAIFTFTSSVAQPFSAFTDVRQEFTVFDNGALNKIEHLPPLEYKIGRQGVAYVDNQGILKLFKDGVVTAINDMATNEFAVSDNLIMFRAANRITVIDGTDVILLSKLCERYKMGDSVVLFYDINKRSFNGYYNGKVTELEGFLNITDSDFDFDKTVAVSDNIGAYINYNDQFKVYYNHHAEELENQRVKEFKVGRNTVAYVDINNVFKIYYNGQSYVIDPFIPKSFQVGDDIVAFQSNDGYFKIFYKGNLFTIGYFEPQYKVADRVVAFEDVNGFFRLFHEGEQTFIDNYYPSKFTLGYNSMAYVNKANMLRLFTKGKVYDISNMSINDFRLDYDLLQYKVGFNAFKMFFEGEFYK